MTMEKKPNIAEKPKGPPNILAEYRITVDAKGQVFVNGPINNLMFFRKVMNVAEKAVIDHIERQMATQKRIIEPNLVVGSS